MNTIYVEGASTAAGQGGGQERQYSWPRRVQAGIRGYYVDNRAVDGHALKAINRKWEADVANGLGRGVVRILSVGQNEARINPDLKRPMFTLQSFAGQLALFSEHTHKANMLPIYVGPQPVDETKNNPTPQGWYIENDLTEEYAAIIQEQAKRDGAPYVDVAKIFNERPLESVLDDDGRHPNAAGHALIAHQVVCELAIVGIQTSLTA